MVRTASIHGSNSGGLRALPKASVSLLSKPGYITKERQNGLLVTEVTHKLMASTPNDKFGGPDDSGSFVFDQYGCQPSGQAKRDIPHGEPHQSARHRIIIMQIIRNSTDNLFRNIAPFLTPGSSLCNNKNR